MKAEARTPAPISLSDDQLGTAAVSLVVSELRWTPDVAPAVLDRISRDAVAYPEQFDRRPRPDAGGAASRPDEPSVGRTISRIVIIGVIIALVAGLVVLAATADAAAVPLAAVAILSPVREALHA